MLRNLHDRLSLLAFVALSLGAFGLLASGCARSTAEDPAAALYDGSGDGVFGGVLGETGGAPGGGAVDAGGGGGGGGSDTGAADAGGGPDTTPPGDVDVPITCPDPGRDDVRYVSDDPGECAATIFDCPGGWSSFDDDCGCGCRRDARCIDGEDPGVDYVATDVDECARIDFSCESPQIGFQNACGCGCQALQGDNCPDPLDPQVAYTGPPGPGCDPGDCAGTRPFDSDCGCGCEVPSLDECNGAEFSTSGLAERFQLFALCEQMIVCVRAGDFRRLESTIDREELPLTCSREVPSVCPEGANGACIGFIGEVDANEVTGVCDLAGLDDVYEIVCAGDL